MAEKDLKTKLRDSVRFYVESVSGYCVLLQYLEYLSGLE